MSAFGEKRLVSFSATMILVSTIILALVIHFEFDVYAVFMVAFQCCYWLVVIIVQSIKRLRRLSLQG